MTTMKCKHCGGQIVERAYGTAWFHVDSNKNRCQVEPYGYLAEPHGDPCAVACIGHEPGLRSVAP